MTACVLVLDGEHRASLAVVRSLGRRGARVHVSASKVPCLAGRSRYAIASHSVADPLGAPETYRTDIMRLTRSVRADLVLPVTEASWLALLEAPEESVDVPLPGGNLARFLRATDKEGVLSTARQIGIRVPDQRVLDPIPGREAEIPVDWFPVAVKPVRSVGGPSDQRRQGGVAYVRTRESLREHLGAQAGGSERLLVQPKLEGPGLGVFLLRWRGEILAAFGHRRIREKPPSGGVSVCSISVKPSPELLARSEALLASLDWEGVAMVEYKRDLATGQDVLMEINPRLWGSVQLAVDAGVDFPWLLVSAALGQPSRVAADWKVGVRLRWFLGDLDHLISRLTHRPRDSFLPVDAPGLFATAATILLPWRPGQRGEVLRLDDPCPGFHEWTTWLAPLLRGKGR